MSESPFWRALTKGLMTGYQTYKDEYLSPAEKAASIAARQSITWDDYESRNFRYLHNNYYYANKAYSGLVNYAQKQRITRGLYKYTRSIYNPVFRLVELHASKSYPNALDIDTLESGAMPFRGLSDNHRSAIRNLWKWSNMASLKSRYPRNVGRFGDCFIQVVDDVFAEKVRLELLHPAYVTDADITPQGYINDLWIGYWRKDDNNPLTLPWFFEMHISKEWFETFKDGEPYAEYTDAEGRPITFWPNEYGFVPVVMVRAIELEHKYGGAIFFPTLDKIDQANDLASLIYDQIRKTVVPMYWLENVSSISNVNSTVVGETERDRVMIMMGPAGSKATPMVANLNLSDSLKALEMLLTEIETDHPELSLHRIRQGERVTAPGTATSYDDAIQRIKDFRGVVDNGMVRAHQMAISIGGFRGYDGFSSFGLNSYDAGDLDIQIDDRPVIGDDLTKKEKIEALNNSSAPKRHVWAEIGMSEEEIARAEEEAETRRREFSDNQQANEEQRPGGDLDG